MERVILWAAAEEDRLQNHEHRHRLPKEPSGYDLERIDRKILRDNSQHMLLTESNFIDNFRLTKDAFRTLCQDLGPYMKVAQRSSAVHSEVKILAALQYYAFGRYQRTVCSGNDYKLGLAQQTISECLAEVTNALNEPDILRKYIKFPLTETERVDVSRGFNDKFGFPGVLGCVDSTHIAIIRPRQNEQTYFNRKYYHSLNVMVICDANMRITYCDASYGGASHNSHIWSSSPVRREMERLHTLGNSYWVLGDSSYPQHHWMMTPILHAAPNSPEEFYTRCHVRTRNVVERCIRVLKSRFRCLLAHRIMHYDPVKAGKIFNACAVLHNLTNNPSFPIDNDEIEQDNERQPPCDALPRDNLEDGGRTSVVQRLWGNRSADCIED